MNISIILAHPDTDSFNHAIANTARDKLLSNNHTVWYHDLYQERFDPLLPAKEFPKGAYITPELDVYCKELQESDGIIIVHPNWWGMPPAILKGWVDRIIRPGVAYEFVDGDSGEGVPVGLLKAKSALVFNTANTSEKREIEVFGDPLERIWKDCIFDLCGVNDFYREMFRIIVTSTEKERKAWLKQVALVVDQYYPEP